MIAYLKGTLVSRGLDRCVIEAGGVGYLVHLTPACSARLAGVGGTVTLHIHHHVREGEQTLYGFLEQSEREVFQRLIGVSGVGPRLALAVLGGLDPVAVQAAILTGDAAALSRVKGVGKKTAERIILELKDRLDVEISGLPFGVEPGVPADVLAALATLGFSRGESLRALREVQGRLGAAGADEILRECVAFLGGGAG